MAKVIAIDRTERHLRYVLAEIGARSPVSVLSADSFDASDETEPAATLLGERLRTLLTEHKATKARLLVGVGRGALESV